LVDRALLRFILMNDSSAEPPPRDKLVSKLLVTGEPLGCVTGHFHDSIAAGAQRSNDPTFTCGTVGS